MIALLVSVGATFGGSLVFEYGFNVETAGDHPAWHESETDVFPAPTATRQSRHDRRPMSGPFRLTRHRSVGL